LSGRGLCDELITRPEESCRLCCVVVCDLETSRMGAPYIYIYDISRLRVKSQGTCKINTAIVSCLYTDSYLNHVYGVICVVLSFSYDLTCHMFGKIISCPALRAYSVSSVAAPSMF